MTHFYSILRFGLYRPRMHACDVIKRSLGRPGSRGKGAVRMGCVMGIKGALWLGKEPLHATEPAGAPRAATRLGFPSSAAARALPNCGHLSGPMHAGSFAEQLESRAHRHALPQQS